MGWSTTIVEEHARGCVSGGVETSREMRWSPGEEAEASRLIRSVLRRQRVVEARAWAKCGEEVRVRAWWQGGVTRDKCAAASSLSDKMMTAEQSARRAKWNLENADVGSGHRSADALAEANWRGLYLARERAEAQRAVAMARARSASESSLSKSRQASMHEAARRQKLERLEVERSRALERSLPIEEKEEKIAEEKYAAGGMIQILGPSLSDYGQMSRQAEGIRDFLAVLDDEDKIDTDKKTRKNNIIQDQQNEAKALTAAAIAALDAAKRVGDASSSAAAVTAASRTAERIRAAADLAANRAATARARGANAAKRIHETKRANRAHQDLDLYAKRHHAALRAAYANKFRQKRHLKSDPVAEQAGKQVVQAAATAAYKATLARINKNDEKIITAKEKEKDGTQKKDKNHSFRMPLLPTLSESLDDTIDKSPRASIPIPSAPEPPGQTKIETPLSSTTSIAKHEDSIAILNPLNQNDENIQSAALNHIEDEDTTAILKPLNQNVQSAAYDEHDEINESKEEMLINDEEPKQDTKLDEPESHSEIPTSFPIESTFDTNQSKNESLIDNLTLGDIEKKEKITEYPLDEAPSDNTRPPESDDEVTEEHKEISNGEVNEENIHQFTREVPDVSPDEINLSPQLIENEESIQKTSLPETDKDEDPSEMSKLYITTSLNETESLQQCIETQTSVEETTPLPMPIDEKEMKSTTSIDADEDLAESLKLQSTPFIDKDTQSITDGSTSSSLSSILRWVQRDRSVSPLKSISEQGKEIPDEYLAVDAVDETLKAAERLLSELDRDDDEDDDDDKTLDAVLGRLDMLADNMRSRNLDFDPKLDLLQSLGDIAGDFSETSTSSVGIIEEDRLPSLRRAVDLYSDGNINAPASSILMSSFDSSVQNLIRDFDSNNVDAILEETDTTSDAADILATLLSNRHS